MNHPRLQKCKKMNHFSGEINNNCDDYSILFKSSFIIYSEKQIYLKKTFNLKSIVISTQIINT